MALGDGRCGRTGRDDGVIDLEAGMCACLSPLMGVRCDGSLKGSSRTCPSCNRWYVPGEEPDPCLGELPGVAGACCGHGDSEVAYISFESGVVIRPMSVETDCRVHRPAVRP